MGLKNKIDSNSIYFLTMTVVDWVDIFTRDDYRHIIIDSLKYCQKEKGLVDNLFVVPYDKPPAFNCFR